MRRGYWVQSNSLLREIICVMSGNNDRIDNGPGSELSVYLHDIKVIICSMTGINIIIHSRILCMEFRTVGGNHIV